MTNIRADYAQQTLVPLSASVIAAVRELNPADTWRRLYAMDQYELVCLAIALAAQVPVDVPQADLLAWTEAWGEPAQPILAEDPSGPVDHVLVHEALMGCLNGRPMNLATQRAVTAEAARRAWTSGRLADVLGISVDTADKRLERHRRRVNTAALAQDAETPAPAAQNAA